MHRIKVEKESATTSFSQLKIITKEKSLTCIKIQDDYEIVHPPATNCPDVHTSACPAFHERGFGSAEEAGFGSADNCLYRMGR
jgi:hypothetical protein